jgi:transmembrane sensor
MSNMTIPATASEWITRLADEPDNAQLRHAHDAWLMASAENRADWDQTLRVWQMLDMTVPVHGTEWAHRVRENTPQQDRISPVGDISHSLRTNRPASCVTVQGHTRRSWRRAGIVGGVFATLVACVLLLVSPAVTERLAADYITATGETLVVDLPDGSIMHLGPESAIALDFDEGRRIKLLDGEAFFEVKPDEKRPFVVRAKEARVTVLGTAFNVQSDRASVDVAVEHGHVRVDGSGVATPRELHAGDAVHVMADGQTVMRKMSPALVASWRNGQLIAKDQPFADMVETVDRYQSGWVVVTDDDLAATSLTGFYDLNDPLAALQAMADAQGAEIKQVSPWLVLISPK